MPRRRAQGIGKNLKVNVKLPGWETKYWRACSSYALRSKIDYSTDNYRVLAPDTIIHVLSSGTSKFRRNPCTSQSTSASRGKCTAPARRRGLALSLLLLAAHHRASSTRF